MEEWWSYSLSDFLLFSPRTYYRLLQRHNEAVWPAQILTVALGIGLLGLLRRPTERQGRIIAAVIALLWTWVGLTFLWLRYATINWAAAYFASLFAIEVLLLLWMGVIRDELRFVPRRDLGGMLGLALFIGAVVAYPLLAPLMGRPWRQAEVFGIFPDPTVLGTIGLVLLARGGSRWALLVIPLMWCAISGATLWAMASLRNAE
jgi:hypothetical protein